MYFNTYLNGKKLFGIPGRRRLNSELGQASLLFVSGLESDTRMLTRVNQVNPEYMGSIDVLGMMTVILMFFHPSHPMPRELICQS